MNFLNISKTDVNITKIKIVLLVLLEACMTYKHSLKLYFNHSCIMDFYQIVLFKKQIKFVLFQFQICIGYCSIAMPLHLQSTSIIFHFTTQSILGRHLPKVTLVDNAIPPKSFHALKYLKVFQSRFNQPV